MRDLDARVARMMGWTDVDLEGDLIGWGVAPGEQWVSKIASPFQQYPHYSTDIAAAQTVETEIERRGQTLAYVEALCREVGVQPMFRCIGKPGSMDIILLFTDVPRLLLAPPAVRCLAALAAVGREGE